MPNWFQDSTQEISDVIAYLERKRQVDNTVTTVTPDHALAMSEYAAYYPTATPGLVRSLAQAGVSPDHPAAQFAITQDMLRKSQEQGNWAGQFGVPTRPTLPPNPVLGWIESFQNTETRNLLDRAEKVGIYLPDADLLVKTPAVTGKHADEDVKKLFYDLVGNINRSTDKPVPYLDAEKGKIYAFDPSIDPTYASMYLSDAAEYEYDPRTRKPVEPGKEMDSEYWSITASAINAAMSSDGFRSTSADTALTKGLDTASSMYQSITQDELKTAAESDPQHPEKYYKAGLDPGSGGSIVPGLVRATAATFDAPVQELQGVVRKSTQSLRGEDVNWLESQSDLGVALPRLIRGQDVDLGSGFFVDPDSAVARERRSREAKNGQIGEHNITIGRLIASTITEPDTKPFQLISGLSDAAVQVYADPTALALGKAKNIATAMDTFQPDEAAGTFRTFRNFFHGPTADAWLNNNTDLIDTFTNIHDPYEIAKLTNFKLPPDLTANLAGSSTTYNTRGILDGAITHGRIRQPSQLAPRGFLGVKQSPRELWQALSPTHNPHSMRIFKEMPSEVWDLENQAQVARNAIRTLHNAHAPESDIRAAYNLVANAKTKNALRTAVMDVQTRVGGLLEHYGITDPEIRSALTRTNQETYVTHARGLVDDIGADIPTWEHMSVNGQITKVTGPHLPVEHISRYIHTPNLREVRRLTSEYPFLTASATRDFIPVLKQVRRRLGYEKVIPAGELRLPLAFLDAATYKVLKPMWLLRLAWPVRVVGEEQFRMASAGLDSLFSGHPISYLAMVVGGEESRLNRLVDRLTPGLKPAYTGTPTGGLMDELDALSEVTYQAHASWLDTPGTVPTNNRTVYTKANPHEASDFRRAWATELSKLSHDPISSKVLNTANIEDVVDWMLTGPGRKFRRQLMDAHPGNLGSRQKVREYLDTVTRRIDHATGGDADILTAIRTGSFTDTTNTTHKINVFSPEPRVNPEFGKYLNPKLVPVAPEKIVGTQYSRSSLQQTFGARWDHAMDRFMYILGGAPTSTLSRSPAFRQFLWKRTAELLPFSDVKTRALILKNAEAAGVSSRQLRHLRYQADRALGTGKLNAQEVEDLAKGYAIDDTKNLLYDLSEKSQAADILRNIAPFGEAWREVITRWANLATIRGPLGLPLPGKPTRRLQQIMQGARGEDFGDFMGAPEGKGFFYKNTFGEEVFAYPGSQWFTNAVTGIPVPLTGRVQGLNMWGSVLPSIGPAIQIPVAWFLHDKPQFDWWREQLLPFGGPGSEEATDILGLDAYAPGWAKSLLKPIAAFLDGHNDDRLYANNTMDVATYLYSTGEYKDTPEDQQRLLNDAKRKAQDLYTIRGFGQFLLPASPSFDWLVQDKTGRNLSLRALAEEFYADQEDDYDNAVANFIDKYGINAIGAVVPHSRSSIYGVPVSLEGAKWVNDNPNLKRNFPLTYGFFAPSGDLHMPTFLRQFTEGTRETLSPGEWQMLKDNLLGNYHYNRALDMLGTRRANPAANQREWLEQQRTNIEAIYPMYGRKEGLSQRPSTDDMVKELYSISADATISSTPAGKALTAYLALRDKAQAQAEAQDYKSFSKPLALAPTRQWLADNAQELIRRYPQFKQLWDIILSREVGDVTEKEPGSYGS